MVACYFRHGVQDSISHLIDIAAIKGLYFPNAIIPASNDPGVNRFQPKGIGLHVFTLKIYAPDGTCVWRTDKLDAGRQVNIGTALTTGS